MSQQQQPPRRVTYGDVFIDLEGELAQKPVAPRDAAMMQTAENVMLGQTLSVGAAAAMQGAAARNERGGFVGHDQMNDAAVDGGVSIIETEVPGRRIIREQVAGQPAPLAPTSTYEQPAMRGGDGISIGEALEATAITAGKKPVELSDAAAFQAAEVWRDSRGGTVGCDD
ncbi:hypothetical protein Ddye_025421 [Dipteronia dyeriana]|uniref:SMP domain-containing protein n=1 Tax=Dipteronia dyeriana TaxID=168575 RepID=A0AAD9TKT1_9ROSI|nr:hypothetical protein Ddye_025421 [Dipteronia dyeriana]